MQLEADHLYLNLKLYANINKKNITLNSVKYYNYIFNSISIHVSEINNLQKESGIIFFWY